MRWLSDVWFRLRALVGRRRLDRELDEELAFHIARETEKLVARGMTLEAARREAHRRFGGVERHRDGAREARGWRWLEDALADARLGLRRMVRSPGFSALAVLTLALGIGGTSAMFGMVNALLLRSLPYPESDRLVWVASAAMITPGNLDDWRAGLRSVEEMGAFDLRSGVLHGRGGARNATYMSVSDEYLRLLGATPARGRLWSAAEAEPGAPPVALVSHRLWLEELGGGDVDGRTVTVGETTYAVVGVPPAGFHNLGYEHVDLWIPLSRAVGSLNLVARLRPAATVADVRQEIDALLPRLDATPGMEQLGRRANVARVRDRFVGDVRAPLLVLLGAAGLVLLLACANVSSLLLSRAAGRSRELAVRSALGARRAALVRQLLVESALLALAGGVTGVLLARWGLRALIALAPPWFDRALLGEVWVDPAVVGFALAAAALATLLAGLAPALGGSRVVLGTARSRVTRRTRIWHERLVAGEVALALLLVIGTALLARTYLTLRPADPGFEVEDRLAVELTLPGLRHLRFNMGPPPESPANAELIRRILAEIEAQAPGSRAAAVVTVPMSGSVWLEPVVAVDGREVEADDDRPPRVDFRPATPDYLDVMGMRVVQGRGVAETDVAGAPQVVVLNRAAAERFWPDVASPVGRRITIDAYGARRPRPADAAGSSVPPLVELTVVGVVADVRSSGNHTRSGPEAYVSYWQLPWPSVQVVVHAPNGGVTAPSLRRTVASLAPAVPLDDVTTIEAVTSRAVSQPRYETVLMTIFGTLAALLAVIGCYGVMAQAVAERTREIGVRIALGATRATVWGEVVGRAARIVVAGLFWGALLALALTRVLESSLYGVSPTDPATFAGAAVMVALASLGAAWLPARRAARIEPVLTLNAE